MINNLAFTPSKDQQQTDGVIGMAPDQGTNGGISYINALKNKGLID
jgi:hypothetical protein